MTEVKTYLLGMSSSDLKIREFTANEIQTLDGWEEYLMVKATSLQNAIDNYYFCWDLREKNPKEYDEAVGAKDFWRSKRMMDYTVHEFRCRVEEQ